MTPQETTVVQDQCELADDGYPIEAPPSFFLREPQSPTLEAMKRLFKKAQNALNSGVERPSG